MLSREMSSALLALEIGVPGGLGSLALAGLGFAVGYLFALRARPEPGRAGLATADRPRPTTAFIAWALPLSVYVASMAFTAVGPGYDHPLTGWEAAVAAFDYVFGGLRWASRGEPAESPVWALFAAWLANPLFLLGIIFLLTQRRWHAVLASVAGLVLTLLLPVCIIPGPNFYLSGYYLWVASMALLAVLSLACAAWYTMRNRPLGPPGPAPEAGVSPASLPSR